MPGLYGGYSKDFWAFCLSLRHATERKVGESLMFVCKSSWFCEDPAGAIGERPLSLELSKRNDYENEGTR